MAALFCLAVPCLLHASSLTARAAAAATIRAADATAMTPHEVLQRMQKTHAAAIQQPNLIFFFSLCACKK